MDGVLVVNDEAHGKAFEVWAERNNIALPENFLSDYYGMGNNEIFPAIFGRELSKEEIAKYGGEKEAIYREIYAPVAVPTKGLVALLDELEARGVKMAVGSSADIENIDMILDVCGLRKYFSAVSYSGLVERAKPAPDIFLLASKMLEVEPSECLVFEDAFAGIKAARAAGMHLGVLATSFPREQHNDYDILIDDFTQITASEIVSLC